MAGGRGAPHCRHRSRAALRARPVRPARCSASGSCTGSSARLDPGPDWSVTTSPHGTSRHGVALTGRRLTGCGLEIGRRLQVRGWLDGRLAGVGEIAGCCSRRRRHRYRRPWTGTAPTGLVLMGRHPRRLNRRQHPGNDVVDLQARGQPVIREQQAMAKHLRCHVVNVLRDEEPPPAQQRQRPPTGQEAECRAGTGAQGDLGSQLGHSPSSRLASTHDQADGIVLHRVMDEHVVGQRLKRLELLGRQHLLGRGRPHAHPMRDLDLLLIRRLLHHDLHEETVPLRLGEGVHPFGLDGVLGGQDQERLGDAPGVPTDGHLALRHDLEQGTLDLGGCSVDFVSQHDVGEHRPPLDVELLLRRPPDPRAHDVGRHQIGCELDTSERPTHHARHGRHSQGLRQAGHALDEAVAPGQQAHEGPLDHTILADDDPFDLEQGIFEYRRSVRHSCSSDRIGKRRAWSRGPRLPLRPAW